MMEAADHPLPYTDLAADYYKEGQEGLSFGVGVTRSSSVVLPRFHLLLFTPLHHSCAVR